MSLGTTQLWQTAVAKGAGYAPSRTSGTKKTTNLCSPANLTAVEWRFTIN